MPDELRDISTPEARGVHTAAVLAKAQLDYALQIASAARGGTHDSVLVGAVLQAIATNYAASQSH